MPYVYVYVCVCVWVVYGRQHEHEPIELTSRLVLQGRAAFALAACAFSGSSVGLSSSAR